LRIADCVRIARRALLWAATCALVAACGTTPKVPPRGGGYYQGDGPPERPPADLASVPDAVPRVEPPHPYANRPYVALGRTYTPLSGDAPFRQRGLASWYGRQFHGNRTASGEIYDMFAMTAAHPTLPIPSYVRVTGVKSGASVIVRVNDRGPFKDDRIIDLSYAAATKLGFAAAGTGEVEIERLTNADIASGRCCRRSALAAAAPVPAPAAEPAAAALPVADSGASTGTPLPEIATARFGEAVPGNTRPDAPRWSVQLGAFAQAANAEALRARLAEQLARNADAFDAPRVERHGSIFRVLIGDLVDRAQAALLAQRLQQLLDRETAVFSR
jgi:rare lipoprotein A